MPSTVTAALEGDVDEFVLRRIVESSGLLLGQVYGRKGKPNLLQSLSGYNNAARFSPWIIVIDLDQDCDCAPQCIEKWLPNPALLMRLRIAVRAIEAWLLADRERIANWLRVSVARVPQNPDELPNPKEQLINLARQSSASRIRSELVPRLGSGRSVGELYAANLIEFAQDEVSGWRPLEAAQVSNSLHRCIECLRRLSNTLNST